MSDTPSREGSPSEKNAIPDSARQEYKEDVVRDMTIEKIRSRLEVLQTKVVKDVENKLDSMVDDIVDEIRLFNLKHYVLKNLFNENYYEYERSNNKTKSKEKGLPEKQFMARNSLLTDLFEVKHIKTIKHIFIVTLIIMFLNTIVHDFIDKGTINIGLTPIIKGLGKFDITLMLWLCMQICTLLLYVFFSIWGLRRQFNNKKRTLTRLWDFTFLLMFIFYQISFIIVFVKAVIHYNLPPGSSIAFMMEQLRFLMKSHAFVRSNAPRVLAGGTIKTDNENKPENNYYIPPFSKYLYFLFAPTLVYRDEYPRTKKIRWNVVFTNGLEVVGVVFYVSFIFECYFIPIFQEFGDVKITAGKFVCAIFGCMVPASLAFLCGFYCLLHCWMNAMAELLTFADRMFYKDWWNASNFQTYIRSWNFVVHDWLYTYIYRDFYEHVFRRCRPLATILVFTISAIFHEYIIAFAFRFFYPVMFVQFEFAGLILMFLTKKHHKDFGNILMWLALCLGNGLHLSLYNMEYYARVNCPITNHTIIDYFIPVSWTCNGILANPDWKMQAPWTNAQ